MKQKLFTVLSVLLITMLAVSPVYAGGVRITFGLGSITADGTAWGFGKDAIITLTGEGVPLVTCATPGNNNLAPGQNPPRVRAADSQPATDDWLGKGKFGVNLEAEPDVTGLSAVELGCPNNNWTANVDFVFWDKATISVINAKGALQYQQNYNCVTTRNPDAISCTPVP